MKPEGRRLLSAGGVIVFLFVLFFTLYISPPQFTSDSWIWLAIAAIAATLNLSIQIAQTAIFVRGEHIDVSLRWITWLSSEKAWINTFLPAKAGTAGAIVVLRNTFNLSWHKYVLFMLACAIATIWVTISGSALLLTSYTQAAGISASALVAGTLVSNFIYKANIAKQSLLFTLAIMNLLSLTLGIGACIVALGYSAQPSEIAPIGLTLNLISIASVTPGNFGFRELVLATLSPLTPVTYSVMVQGSAAFVLIRGLICLAVATFFRGSAATAG